MEHEHIVEPMLVKQPETEVAAAVDNKAPIKKLFIVAAVCLLFMVAEIVGGLLANSIAILTDAAHLLSDLTGFAISVVSLYISQRPATSKMSFGYHRAEIIGAILSMALIWGLTIWLVFEAVQRIITPVEVDGLIMLITAIFGFVCNLVMFKLLHSHGPGHGHGCSHGHSHDHGHKHSHDDHDHEHEHGHGHEHGDDHKHEHGHKHGHGHKHKCKEHKHDHKHDHKHGHKHEKEMQQSHKQLKELVTSLREGLVIEEPPKAKEKQNVNVRAALLHVIGDLIQSIGVIIAAIIVFCRPDWSIADPLCTLLFSVIVMFTTFPIIKECTEVLMEGTPLQIETSNLEADFKKIKGVLKIHDLHVWSLSVGKLSLSVHLVAEDPVKALSDATRLCNKKYSIKHTTIQCEMHEPESSASLNCTKEFHTH